MFLELVQTVCKRLFHDYADLAVCLPYQACCSPQSKGEEQAELLSNIFATLASPPQCCIHFQVSYTFRHISSRANAVQAASAANSAGPSKAAALIIGNEILSGSITDTNTPWLAQLLYK